jgi:hypothetical protein
MNFLSLLKTRRFWQNFMVFGGAILIPSWLLKESNEHVFPGAADMANGMILIVITGAAVAMITASDERADGACRITAMIGKVILGAVMFWNLGGHWQLTREVDSAKAGVQERREEEKIQDQRANEQTQREKDLSAARAIEAEKLAKLEEKQAINRDAASRLFNRTGVLPPGMTVPPKRQAAPIPSPTIQFIEPTPTALPTIIKPRRSPDEVREAWNSSLTKRAYVEAGCSIMLMVILSVLWYADFDNNGISDRIQRLPKEIVQKHYPQHYEQLFSEPLPQRTISGKGRPIGMAPPIGSQGSTQEEAKIAIEGK